MGQAGGEGGRIIRPLVSIIVPVYNVESYLPQCIESILAQTYEHLEMILVDDGSTDSSGKICEEYADRDTRIQTIHKPNEGLAAARNQGLEVARGAYCSFVDSDDSIAQDYIEYLYDMASENSAQIAVCGYQKVYGERSGNFLFENVLGRSKKKKAVKVYDTFGALSALLYQRGIIASAWGRLFRRELFSDIRFPEGRQHEDVAVMYQLFDQAGKIVVGSEKKYFYLQRPGSIIHSAFDQSRMDYIVSTQECIEYMQGRYPGLVNAAVSRHFSACFELLASMPPASAGMGNGNAYRKLAQEIKKHRKTVLCDRSARPTNRLAAVGSCISIAVMQKLCHLKRI